MMTTSAPFGFYKALEIFLSIVVGYLFSGFYVPFGIHHYSFPFTECSTAGFA